MDDQPLFGEKKSSTTLVQAIVAGLLLIFVGYCVVIAVIFGLDGHYEHFVLLALLLLACAQLAVCFLFYKQDSQEEAKFLWLCILAVVVIVVCGTTLNVYVWVDYSADKSSSSSSSSGDSGSDAKCESCLACNGSTSYYNQMYQCITCEPGKLIDPQNGLCVSGGNGSNGTNGSFAANFRQSTLRKLVDARELERIQKVEHAKANE
eukprot:TRINITY_DN2120_c0_g1_i1.p1 TRINITY_DN2120_c0_g1~~TRINITY_DN2120_c0_g1_i1.p1  ORF type:complete len:235 (-),score=85.80 TRINITY_DN2120_c0_g1_i1:782-1399(-)